MAIQRHLARAPITEAVIDLRADLAPGFDLASFDELTRQVSDDYPIVEPAHLFSGQIEISRGGISQRTDDRGLQGLVCRSADQTQIAQFRRDGFTFNRLKPYTSWDQVFREAWRLWGKYRQIAAPRHIPRIAVRYINHITIPGECDFGRYLTDPPVLPPAMPTSMHSYFKRVVGQDPSTKHCAIVVHALEAGPERSTWVLLMDIDVFAVSNGEGVDTDLEHTFQQLHEEKNRIFFSALTEDTVGMFE
jgi:uncharacterized protein (TIGR04255 family)